MEHSFADILAHLFDGETIRPGDVLASGTVGRGCGLELDRWLSPGDTIELAVKGIRTSPTGSSRPTDRPVVGGDRRDVEVTD